MSTKRAMAWRIEARDPLVFGDGTRQPALMGGQRAWLPPQGTLAGFVRTGFWTPVTNETEARRQSKKLLAGIELRGPWLRGPWGGPGDHGPLWLPSPLDARRYQAEDGEWRLTRPARLLRLAKHEGLSLGRGAEFRPHRAVTVEDKLEGGTKTQELRFPLWRLDHIVAWSLDEPIDAHTIAELRPRAPLPLELERRVHVGLDDDHGTAIPEALFASSGTRIRDGHVIAVDVSAESELPPTNPGTGTLGGRSRPSHVHVDDGCHWPDFSTYEARYARVLEHSGKRALLRLQLVTPGCFGGWLPPLSDVSLLSGLTLEAALIPAFSVESGWDMVNRRPRAVRRLVSPGAIYWYSVDDPARLLELCEYFWSSPLPSATFEDPTRARPSGDGYGQVIPGLHLEES